MLHESCFSTLLCFMCVKYIYFTLCFALAAKGHKDCVELLVSSNAPLNGKDKVNVL